MEKINYSNLCPVCGYDFFAEFGFKPWHDKSPSDEICPSCGFQFGLDDYDNNKGYETKSEKYYLWRKKWISNECRWYSEGIKKPENWNQKEQLKNIGVDI